LAIHHKRSLEAVLFHDIAGLFEMAVCCAKPPYATYPNPTGQPYTLSYSYQYSPAGRKTQLVWADGTAIDYGYSAHGELDSVTIPGEGIISVSQFNWTAPASVILPGGSVQNKAYDVRMADES
jgi:YD repeat-containing protein